MKIERKVRTIAAALNFSLVLFPGLPSSALAYLGFALAFSGSSEFEPLWWTVVVGIGFSTLAITPLINGVALLLKQTRVGIRIAVVVMNAFSIVVYALLLSPWEFTSGVGGSLLSVSMMIVLAASTVLVWCRKDYD